MILTQTNGGRGHIPTSEQVEKQQGSSPRYDASLVKLSERFVKSFLIYYAEMQSGEKTKGKLSKYKDLSAKCLNQSCHISHIF